MARAGVGDAETHGDFVEETGFRQRGRSGREVIADEEKDLVLAGLHFIGAQKRLVGPAIRVGFHRRDQFALFTIQRPQFDFHSRRRAAVRGVKNMRA